MWIESSPHLRLTHSTIQELQRAIAAETISRSNLFFVGDLSYVLEIREDVLSAHFLHLSVRFRSVSNSVAGTGTGGEETRENALRHRRERDPAKPAGVSAEVQRDVARIRLRRRSAHQLGAHATVRAIAVSAPGTSHIQKSLVTSSFTALERLAATPLHSLPVLRLQPRGERRADRCGTVRERERLRGGERGAVDATALAASHGRGDGAEREVCAEEEGSARDRGEVGLLQGEAGGAAAAEEGRGGGDNDDFITARNRRFFRRLSHRLALLPSLRSLLLLHPPHAIAPAHLQGCRDLSLLLLAAPPPTHHHLSLPVLPPRVASVRTARDGRARLR